METIEVPETQTSVETSTEQEVELLIDNEYADEEVTPTEPSEQLESTTSEHEDESTNDNKTSENAMAYDPDEKSDKDYILKINGQESEVTLKELKMLAQQGVSYSHKTMKLAEHKNLLGSLEQYGIKTVEELNDFIAKGGQQIEKAPESPYSDATEQLAEQIMSQPNAGEFKEMVSAMPEMAVNTLADNPRTLSAFYQDFNSGTAQKLMPETNKIMALRPELDFINAYALAGKKVFGDGKNNKGVAIQQPNNTFESENSEILSDKDFQAITERLTNLS